MREGGGGGIEGIYTSCKAPGTCNGAGEGPLNVIEGISDAATTSTHT